jgi:hypothetical protein
LSYLEIMRPIAIIFLILIAFSASAQKLDVHGGKGQPAAYLAAINSDEGSASALINGNLYDAIVIDGDTIPVIKLPVASATGKRVFKSKKSEKRYRRLEFHIKKVYPYAKLASEKMKEVELEVAGMTKRERKRRMKQLEKEIKHEYTGQLKKMTFTQGRILIKLLDRETGDVSYDIVATFRGRFTAWFFQGIAKMFDYDLKSEYDAKGKDKLIEGIVQRIERGEL